MTPKFVTIIVDDENPKGKLWFLMKGFPEINIAMKELRGGQDTPTLFPLEDQGLYGGEEALKKSS